MQMPAPEGLDNEHLSNDYKLLHDIRDKLSDYVKFSEMLKVGTQRRSAVFAQFNKLYIKTIDLRSVKRGLNSLLALSRDSAWSEDQALLLRCKFGRIIGEGVKAVEDNVRRNQLP